MKKFLKKMRYIGTLASCALLLACGGGGSVSSDTTQTSSTATNPSPRSLAALATEPGCNPGWQATQIYTGNELVSYQNQNFQANWWTQGNDPSTNSGPAGSGMPWLPLGACADSSDPPAPPDPVAPPLNGDTDCNPAWQATQIYTGNELVSYQNQNYRANWWTQGNDPSTNSGPAGSGMPWLALGTCGDSSDIPTPPDPPTPPSPPPTPVITSLVLSPYKDVGINLNWNTDVLTTAVTGTLTPLISVLPEKLPTVTLAFATGTCGAESWAGIGGPALAQANIQSFIDAGKTYIISTGGAEGSFTCTSDDGFATFIRTYYSANMLGVDFDIEGGQSQADIAALVQRVKVAQTTYPALHFSFTVATLGSATSPNLSGNDVGVAVLNAINAAGLTNYTINLMVMDYGSSIASNCVLNATNRCDMGLSAIAAANSLHNSFGVPYNQIELTPMIGGNDTIDEVFTLADVATITAFAQQVGLAGLHYWSLDRDNDCAQGYASPTCNSYGAAGTLGYTNAFISGLGF